MRKFVTGAAAMVAAAGATLAVSAPQANAAGYYYGAIAISYSTGYIGYSYDYADSGTAESRAVSQCGQADCQAVEWFANGCGAVAYSRSTGTWSWGYAASRLGAQNRALSYNNAGAAIVHWNCTSNHG
ncbi:MULTISPECIES: DUF4189 domain-containing protein [unclassified Nocardia]|uniref:DUF4189 domain-containing protein n=1 Tax=unclassified Nocardia TaxID=2637762 RepID=UPI001CE3C21A|nr:MULTISPECIES: DUF4189 domain-containing protein [unclassified Nocardia]